MKITAKRFLYSLLALLILLNIADIATLTEDITIKKKGSQALSIEATTEDVVSVSDAEAFQNALKSTASIINLEADITIESTSGNKTIYLAYTSSYGHGNRTINGNGHTITFNGIGSNNNAFTIMGDNITLNNLTLVNSEKTQATLNVYRSKNIVLNNVTVIKKHSDSYNGAAIINNASQIIVEGNLSINVPLKSWGGINLGGASSSVGTATMHFNEGSDFLYSISDSTVQCPVPIYADSTSTTLYSVTNASQNLNITREYISSPVSRSAFMPERTVLVTNEQELSSALQHPLTTTILLGNNITANTTVTFDATITSTTYNDTTGFRVKEYVRSLVVNGNNNSIKLNSSMATMLRLASSENAFTIASSNVSLKNITLENSADKTNVLAIVNASNVVLDNLTIVKASSENAGYGILIKSSGVTVANTLTLIIPEEAHSAIYMDVDEETLGSAAGLTFDTNSDLVFLGSHTIPIIDINTNASESIAIDSSSSENVDIGIEQNGAVTIDLPNNKYTVTFHSNGGSEVPSQIVTHKTAVTAPTNPIKYNYLFGGWYTDNDTYEYAWDFQTTLEGSLNLYAKWTQIRTTNPTIATVTTKSNVTTESTTATESTDATIPSDAEIPYNLEAADNPETGEDNMLPLWIMVFCFSLGTIGIMFKKKKG